MSKNGGYCESIRMNEWFFSLLFREWGWTHILLLELVELTYREPATKNWKKSFHFTMKFSTENIITIQKHVLNLQLKHMNLIIVIICLKTHSDPYFLLELKNLSCRKPATFHVLSKLMSENRNVLIFRFRTFLHFPIRKL